MFNVTFLNIIYVFGVAVGEGNFTSPLHRALRD